MLIILSMNGLIPDPKPFGTGVDSRTYTEPFALVEDDTIKQVAFSSTIQASNSHHTQGSIDFIEELLSLRTELVN